jgi:hypothetical protein
MELRAYSGKAKRGVGGGKTDARTTVPGFVNQNGQRTVARTGFPSASFAGQIIYKMCCGHCRAEYGANGCDIHSRRCPVCQGGSEGEVLREMAPGLFGSCADGEG